MQREKCVITGKLYVCNGGYSLQNANTHLQQPSFVWKYKKLNITANEPSWKFIDDQKIEIQVFSEAPLSLFL